MKRKRNKYDYIFYGSLTLIGLAALSNLTVEAEEYIPAVATYSEEVTAEVIPTYTKVSDTYSVGSEGVSTYYSNTIVNGVRSGEVDVKTSTQDVPGLGEDICVGRPLDNTPDNPQYACVVLPESLSDTYNRGDIVLVEYDDGDGVNGIFPCVVIDFNQTEHGDHLNFVGDFHPPYGATAWIVEEEKDV